MALVVRLIDLGDRAFHHDESQVAYYSFQYWRDHAYEYNPLLHGPWQYMTGALAFLVAGASDFTARLGPALMGTAIVALPFFARRQLGRLAAFSAALALAVSPSLLYFSRFAREDVHIAALTLAVVVLALRFLDEPRRWHPAVAGTLLAGTLTVKESGLFFGALGALFIVAVLSRPGPRMRLATAAKAVTARWWIGAVVAFAVFYALLYSSLGANPGGVWDGIYEGPSYWLGQHDVGRGGEPWFYYFVLLAGYEWPLVALAGVGTAAVWRSPDVMRVFIVVWAIGSLAFYTWAGEKFPWLVVHPLLPLALLAGLGVQAVWRAPSGRRRVAGIALVLVGDGFLASASWRVNAAHPTDPTELLVSTQTAPDATVVADELIALDARLQRSQGRRARVIVDTTGTGGFPWAWSLRALEVSFLGQGGAYADADAFILGDAAQQAFGPQLTGHEGRAFTFRVFRPNFYAITPARFTRWLVRRRPLGETGTSPAWLYVRR